jgi:hypothetical protein
MPSDDDDRRIEVAEFELQWPEPADEEQLDRAEDRYLNSLANMPGWDSSHDQEAPCADCGHTYYRHWDWGNGYQPGCKYCPCSSFREDRYLNED